MTLPTRQCRYSGEKPVRFMRHQKGLHPRIELGDINQAAPYLKMGVKHFCIGWDVRVLYEQAAVTY